MGNEGLRTCTDVRTQGSLTQTVAVSDQDQDPLRAADQLEPWWVGSRLSGPRGGPSRSRDCHMEPNASVCECNNTSTSTCAISGEQLPNPEELRRLRLARFG